jgi:membrane-associated phospholipid phosphatase
MDDRRRALNRLHRFLVARVDRGSELGLELTVGFFLFIGATSVFGELLEQVLANAALVRADKALHVWVHQSHSPTIYQAFAAFTDIGTTGVWTIIPIVAAWLLWKRRLLLLGGWLGTTLAGHELQGFLKATIHRPRPEFSGRYIGRMTSFPSGHTMGSTICFILLAFVLVTVFRWTGPKRWLVYGVASVLIFLVALSRVYLGVHYLSDVFGGFLAGLAWTMMAITLMRIAMHRPKKATHDDVPKEVAPASPFSQ